MNHPIGSTATHTESDNPAERIRWTFPELQASASTAAALAEAGAAVTLVARFEDAAFKTSVLAKIKLGRIGRVEDLMGAILFLASDASAMMTGTSMVVDGGWSAD